MRKFFPAEPARPSAPPRTERVVESSCTKTGRPVVDVLHSKHPPLRELSDVGSATFEKYSEIPDPPYIDVTQDMIEKVVTRLSGAAGPSGVDAVDLQNWLLRYGKESKALREELAAWRSGLANESPLWAADRVMMACPLVALDKQLGVRPVGVASWPKQYCFRSDQRRRAPATI
jgi:hypothetical protein